MGYESIPFGKVEEEGSDGLLHRLGVDLYTWSDG